MFCRVADDVSNLCAGGTQNAKPKNLWRQASKLCSQFSFSWVCCSPRHELPLCVSYWISQQIWSIGYCRNQRSTAWFIHKTELNFRKKSNACTQWTTIWSRCISFRTTELKKIYIELLLEDYIKYTLYVTRFAQRLKVELEPFFYCNNSVQTSKISKSVWLCFSEDVNEIISNELQNPATFFTSLVGLISPIRKAMSKVSNTLFNSSFPPDCQEASVPIQLQILCSLIIDGCNPQIKDIS